MGSYRQQQEQEEYELFLLTKGICDGNTSDDFGRKRVRKNNKFSKLRSKKVHAVQANKQAFAFPF